MKNFTISQFAPCEHPEPATLQQLIETIRAGGFGLEGLEDDVAASQIDDAVQNLLTEDESIEEFYDYNEADINFYRVGGEICVYWRAAGVLRCGSIEEHAAVDVKSFRTYLSERDDDLNTSSPVNAM